MDFRILGPLEALDRGERVALGGTKRRAVLALLLLHANETVSAERLIDELWGEAPPATAAKSLHAHVSRLRRALAGASGGAAEGPIVTRGHGYELQVETDAVDSHRFERLLADARGQLAEERPDRALPMLEEALGLWKGTPLADLAYEPFAQAEIARLEDLRVNALEELVEAKLALGRHSEVIGELETLIEQYPYRERLRAQLMVALYRADRQADALQAYQNARTRLVDELGIEPGERLRSLEAAVLAQDAALAVPAVAVRDEPAAPEAPEADGAGLPSGVVTFVLTDIEGSSGLWESDFHAMAAALTLHDELIGRAADSHDGRVLKMKGEGDSTVTVFRRASDAVAAAAELQRLLRTADWPQELVPSVRVAVHTGEAHERDGDYFGPALNRAARLRALAAGGAVLLSQATAELVRDRLPAGFELADLGRRDLRGLSRPEQVFELREPGSAEPTPAAPVRKVVTVLFACVMDPAPGAQEVDAEVRRRVSTRLLDDVREALEAHGGTVEEYPGEALMAVYGVPRLHEDDAVRAVRAAAELRDLAGERLRVGIGTGEVIAEPGPADRSIVAGDAVNAAKRLQEAAGAGETLLDDRTSRLVRGFADTEPSPAEPAAARLSGLRSDGGRPRGLESPLVGRSQQLEALGRAFAAAVAGRTCHLVSVLGVAGVGKSRLVDEFTEALGDEAIVVCARCLPYGDGITYWPLGEIVRDLPDGMAAHVADDPKAGEVVTVISDAVGLERSAGATGERIFWAARRLLEAVARRRPLIVVLDDLQWAEPTFLDLVEHVAELARDAPIVLLCMARPELLDGRPGWGGGKLNATSIHLEPLGPAETGELVGNLLSRAAVPEEAVARVREASEGNPLFAEELLSMLIDEGLLQRDGDEWALHGAAGELPVPPTIHVLLAARLERLPDDERALLARVSVIGNVFYLDAVRELAPATLVPAIDRSLTALVRRDVIRPERSTFFDDDTYRFRHILIRDAAYRSLPKEVRAELHERVAAWMERVAGARLTELEEIVGYHLEQAYSFLAELNALDSDAERLAARGSERLESAARRALGRSDVTAAVGLLERAAALVPGDDARQAVLLPDLGAALMETGRLAEAADALDAGSRAAATAGDDRAEARARVQSEFLRLQRGESDGTGEAVAVVEDTLPVFQNAGDEHGLCDALRLRAWSHWIEGRTELAASAWEDAAGHAREAGAEHERVEILGWIASSLFFGPTDVSEGIRRCDAIRAEVETNPAALAELLQPLAGLHAMQGDFEAARELLASSDAAFRELGLTLNSAVSHHAAMVELLAGDAAAAEHSLRRGYATLEAMGDTALLSTTAAFLGQALLAQGRPSEAEELADVSARLAARDDLITHVLWRGVRARCLVERGGGEDAEGLAREAVALAEQTDLLSHKGDALVDLGIVLRTLRRPREAQAAFDEAVRLYERKGNVVATERTRADLVR
jgi:predicted ATPase/class 3 adenylate cyclase/DNA-binding winged helix-turn-helix (wHTH) protein